MTIRFTVLTTFFYLTCLSIPCQAAPAQTVPQTIPHSKRGVHIPVNRRSKARATSIFPRGDAMTSADLGNAGNKPYTVQMQVGNTTVPFLLDTGSSDLWVVSEDCQDPICKNGISLYSPSTFHSTGLSTNLSFGDSASPSFASGVIGLDTVTLAGIETKGQVLASINDTNLNLPRSQTSGIFGLGFPTNSKVLFELIEEQKTPISSLDQVPDTFATVGPLMPRLCQDTLALPEFALTLNRQSDDTEGNPGLLSIGELPPGVHNDSLTWVPVRRYTPAEGGLASGNETFPTHWEVPIDDVFIDGQRLPQSTLSPNITLSALIDSGSESIRGPRDVVAALNTILSGSPNSNIIDCSIPHTLAFQIGGKMFPIDPRDFVTQTEPGSLDNCTTNVLPTDPPHHGFQFAWSIGMPLFKGSTIDFYFGNLTHPSVDLPRIGFLSTVPPNADMEYLNALARAKQNGNNFPTPVEDAPAPTVSVFTTVFPPSSVPTNASSGVPPHSPSVSSGSPRLSPLFTRETAGKVVEKSLEFASYLNVLSQRFRLMA